MAAPQSSVEELAGLQTYITGTRDSKRAIILLSDAYGFEGKNLRLADKVAEAGFLVVVPDFFRGDPIDSGKHSDRAEWLRTHTAEKGCEDALAVVDALKSKGVTAIGAAGFCWGGSTVSKLAKFDCIKAGVLVHPSTLFAEDFQEIKVPMALLGAETDHLCTAEHLTNLNSILSAKPEVDNFLKIYPGVKHGWAMMYKDEDKAAVKMAEEAHSDMLNWLTKAPQATFAHWLANDKNMKQSDISKLLINSQ
ncbi:OLC1v1020204C1 [Oldenlandia corymbosa var. corymbosa]|uniref:OLC1v1020204C1 n=1 Tax=Oldenlandia corymbosa var. corymbosa TaxID=529605 RepID=A0AAV1EFS9_OLDCO|nr:OLC1v1020204C1 [Oldenlandia corymbosa var. corymbosa]